MPQGILNSQRMYSGSNHQPHPLRAGIFSNATMPAQKTKQKNPNHIIINQTGSYSFLYSHTGSLGSTLTGMVYTSASIITSNQSLPIRLDISPCAWQGSGLGRTGDVTFVYRGN